MAQAARELSRNEKMRRGLQRKLQMLKRHHQIGDEVYRDRLEQVTGKRSSKALNVKEFAAVLNSYAAQGIHPPEPQKSSKKARQKPKVSAARQAQLDKIEALLAEKGRVEGQHIPWAYAEGILKRLYKIDQIAWANGRQLGGVITALTKDAKRKGRALD